MKKALLSALILQVVVLPAWTQVITDPTLTSGSGAIAPNNAITLNASNSVSQTTLEGLSGFAAIHDWSFTGTYGDSISRIINFTSASLPDFQFGFEGFNTGNNVVITNNTFITSNGSGLQVRPSSSSGSITITLTLGSYNTDTSTFSSFSSSGVNALAFTLSSGGRWNTIAGGITVNYLDAAGATLSTQVFPTTAAGNVYGYTGYQISEGQNPIAKVTVSFTGNGGANTPLLGFDDLGFTAVAVPEPSAVGFLSLALGAFLVLGHVKRRSRFSTGAKL